MQKYKKNYKRKPRRQNKKKRNIIANPAGVAKFYADAARGGLPWLGKELRRMATQNSAAIKHAGEVGAAERKAGTPAYQKWLKDNEGDTLMSGPSHPAPGVVKRVISTDSLDATKKKLKFTGARRGASVVHGKTGPAIARARRAKTSKFSRPGVQLITENRTTITDPQCVYVGYGVPVNQAIRSMFFCVVKKLFTVAGYQVNNYDEPVPRVANQTLIVTLTFYASNISTGITTITSTIDGTANQVTYVNCADNLNTAADVWVTAAQSIYQIHWSKATLTQTTTDSGTNTSTVSLAEIPLDRSSVVLNYKAKLRIQNTTQAAGGTGQEKLMLDRIDVNPIRGIKYVGTRLNNAILPRIRDDTTQPNYKAFMADRDSGLFAIKAADLLGTFSSLQAGMSSGFNKPPPPNSFQSVKAASVKLEPGEIKTDYLSYTYRGSFQNFFTKLMGQFQDRTGTTQVNFGKVTMFAFEHMLYQTTDAAVNVDVQHDWTIGSSITFKKPLTVPVVRVQS